MATRNAQAGVAWTANMLLGAEDYQAEAQQLNYHPGLFACVGSPRPLAPGPALLANGTTT